MFFVEKTYCFLKILNVTEIFMRRLICVFLTVFLCFGIVSCGETRSASEMLFEFVSAYGAEGVVYRSDAEEWEEGYVEYDLLKKIYVFYQYFPEDFAIFLNSHADYGSECGVFVCRDGGEVSEVEEMCLERIKLLGRGDENSFVVREGRIVFYSTMSDSERARKIWQSVKK